MREHNKGSKQRSDGRASVPADLEDRCARPSLPPEARRATRDDSGWKTAEPMPINEAANNSNAKVGAMASSSRPMKVTTMPIGSVTAWAYGRYNAR